jgi:hypothetical protein
MNSRSRKIALWHYPDERDDILIGFELEVTEKSEGNHDGHTRR